MFEKSDNSIFAFYSEQRQSKILKTRIWILQIVAAITFLMQGGSKLDGVKMIVNAFEQIGIGHRTGGSR